jgi:hypothetical protein
MYPSDSVVIVVLVNRDNPGLAIGRIAATIAGIVLPRYAATAAERRAGTVGAVQSPPLSGSWRGFTIVERDSVPVVLTVAPEGVRIQIGGDSARTFARLTGTNGWYSGNFRSPLRVPEAAPLREAGRNAVGFSLRLHGDRLTGWMSSLSQGPPNYGAVSYRLELQK